MLVMTEDRLEGCTFSDIITEPLLGLLAFEDGKNVNKIRKSSCSFCFLSPIFF